MHPSRYFEQLHHWYQSPLGKTVANSVQKKLEPRLNGLFGYFLLEYGLPSPQFWLRSSRVRHHVLLDIADLAHDQHCIHSDPEYLPIATESVDIAFLAHSLECRTEPYTFLAEINRTVVAGGYILLLGFNPYSLWGLWRYCTFANTEKRAPWSGRFQSAFAVAHQLRRLGYTIKAIDPLFFRPPLKDKAMLNRLELIESMGELLWPYPNGLYVLLARKCVPTPITIEPVWRFRQYSFGKNLQPANRGISVNNSKSVETKD